MEEEKKFFAYCWERMNKIESLKSKIKAISSNYKRKTDYNPMKYVRGSKLIDESFIYSNFPELNFSKNLKEWKENEKNGKKNVMSYEDYLSKGKAEMQNAEAARNSLSTNWGSNINKNASNPNSAKSSNDNLTGSSTATNFSYSNENFQNRNSLNLNCQTNTINNDTRYAITDANVINSNLSANYSFTLNDSIKNNVCYHNNLSSADFKENKINNSIPGYQAAPIFNPYQNQNGSFQNMNPIVANQSASAGGYGFNNGFGISTNLTSGSNSNYQFDYRSDSNLNNTFTSSNTKNIFNMKDFYNVENLNFPK